MVEYRSYKAGFLSFHLKPFVLFVLSLILLDPLKLLLRRRIAL